MKYIKVAEYGIFGSDNLTREDLARAKSGQYVAIINRITEEVFDSEKND